MVWFLYIIFFLVVVVVVVVGSVWSALLYLL